MANGLASIRTTLQEEMCKKEDKSHPEFTYKFGVHIKFQKKKMFYGLNIVLTGDCEPPQGPRAGQKCGI